MSESKGSFHIDVSALVVVGVIAAAAFAGYKLKQEADRERQREIVDAENAKKERELKEQELEAKAAERDAIRRADEIAQRREAQERQDAAAAALAQERKDRAAKDEARRQGFEERQQKFAEAVEADRQEQIAEAKRKEDAIVAGLRQQHGGAIKELEQLQKKRPSVAAKLAALKAKTEAAARTLDALRKVPRRSARTDAAIAALEKEYQVDSAALASAQEEYARLDSGIREATASRDQSASRLRNLGADLAEKPLSQPKPVVKTAEPVPVRKKFFILKDGTKIVATGAMDAGDVWSVKTEAGKFETIQKNLVEKVVEEE